MFQSQVLRSVEQLALPELARVISASNGRIASLCEAVQPLVKSTPGPIGGVLQRILVRVRDHQRRSEVFLQYLSDFRNGEVVPRHLPQRLRRRLALDHTELKYSIEELRRITADYQTGAGTETLARLRELDGLIEKHIDLTYEVLFPRIVESENALAQDAAVECEPW